MNNLPSDLVHFIEAHKDTFILAFGWLVREFWTIGAAGGLVGLYKYFVYGIKPAQPAQPEKPLPITNPDSKTV